MQDAPLVSDVPAFLSCVVTIYVSKLLKTGYLLIRSAVISVKDYKTVVPYMT